MAPWDYVLKLKDENPTAFSILLGAIAAVAAVSIIVTIGGDLQAQLPNIVYVIAIGAVLLVLSAAFKDGAIMNALKWFAVVMFVGWVGAFIWSKVNPGVPVPDCAAWFWKDCAALADAAAEIENKSPPVQPVPLPQPPTAAVKPADFSVTFQFAGTLRRDDVRTVMTQLQKAGWNMQGVSGGGQRTATAAGYAEVRYGPAADAEAAADLAKAVQASGIINRPISTASNAGIPAKTLEIYVSN